VKLILASASPRRAALLSQAGYEFVVHASNFDEAAQLEKILPRKLAGFLATGKARDVAARFPEDVILAADTVIAFGDTPLGKPHDANDARDMIRLLGGATHVVITGVAVHCLARKIELEETAMSAVRMMPLCASELDRYVASERWRGKAGGYGIQDAESIVTCVGGSVSNVVGLPMSLTRRLLAQAGVVPGRSDNGLAGHGGGPSV
jgi:septum formation protein